MLPLRRMLETLKLLASPADVQLEVLSSDVVVADELALIFDDELLALDPAACSEAARARLTAIAQALSAMSDRRELWTTDALRTADDWKRIRMDAAAVLAAFGEPVERPTIDWLTYVRG